MFYSHAQSLAALQAYSHWLAQFCSEVQRQQHQTQFVDLVTSSMAATTPLINAKVHFFPCLRFSAWSAFLTSWHELHWFQVPEKLLLSACHLIVSMATTVRPVFLVSLPAAQNIFNLITENHNHRLPQEVRVWFCSSSFARFDLLFAMSRLSFVSFSGSRPRVSSSLKHATVALAQPAGSRAAVAEPFGQSRPTHQQSYAAVPPPAPPT